MPASSLNNQPDEARAQEEVEAAQPVLRNSHQLYHVRPSDGKLAPLILQSFQDVHSLPPAPLWQRLSIRPLSPATTLGKMSYWIGAPVLVPGTTRIDFTRSAAVAEAALRLVVSWPLSCFLFYGLEFMSSPFDSSFENRGAQLILADNRYTPVRHMATMETSSPIFDASELDNSSGRGRQAYTDIIRLGTAVTSSTAPQRGSSRDGAHSLLLETTDQGTASRPRYLCYIRDYEQKVFETIHVSQFLEDEGDDVDMEFVFVSYTREQFRVATDEEISNYEEYPDEAIREANRQLAQRDRQLLVAWGIDAAQRAGKRAFWIDFECVRDVDGLARSSSKSDDVYRICDIVRAAHSMIIATSPPADEKLATILAGQRPLSSLTASAEATPSAGGGNGQQQQQTTTTTKWLRHWGSRLWTLPELLLCPNEHRVKVYVFGQDTTTRHPISLAKRNFAERAWDDAELVKELVNHYEGSAILSPLQLTETALACFARRGTQKFSPGDIAYALMGLLPSSQRPAVCSGDTGFQAFARLSLAYDGGDFLSRMASLSPPSPLAAAEQDEEVDHVPPTPWYDNVKDKWGARIHDVHPSSRVVKVASNAIDTLVLDGAYSASIRWDRFDANAVRKGEMPPKSSAFVATLVWSGMLSFTLGIMLRLFDYMSSTHRGNPWPRRTHLSLIACGVVIALPALVAPLLYLRGQQSSRPRIVKAELVGVEGHVDAAVVERHLWGFNHGRFRSVYASDSVYQDAATVLGGGRDDVDRNAEVSNNIQPMASSPTSPPAPQQRNSKSKLRERFQFTIVDTHMMTVTHISAYKPPIAVFIIGGEAGLQRALLCSYDWRDDTFERETVLRVSTAMLDQMRRISQFRLRLSSSHVNHHSVSAVEDDMKNHLTGVVMAYDGVSRWKMGLLFATITFLALDMVTPLNNISSPDWESTLEREPERYLWTLYYGLTFMLAQIPAFLTISKLSMARVLPQLVLLKGFLPGLLSLVPYTNAGFITRSALTGTIDGILYPVLITLLWSWWWYSPSQFTAHALSFAALAIIIPPLGHYALLCMGLQTEQLDALVYFFSAVGYLLHGCIATLGRRRIGRPEEVGLVSASVKMKLTMPSTAEHPSHTLQKKQLSPFVLAVVAALAHLGTDGPTMTIGTMTGAFWLTVVSVGIIVVCTVIVSKTERATIPLIITVILLASAGTAWSNHDRGFRAVAARVLVDLRIMVQPLLWVLANSLLHTNTLKLQTLCLSLAGMAVGSLLKTTGFAMQTWQVQIPASATAIVLLSWLWVYNEAYWRGRIAL